MPLFTSAQRRFAQAVADLGHCNPFLPRRIELEHLALGEKFDARDSDWNVRGHIHDDHPNVSRLIALARELAESTQHRLLSERPAPGNEELTLYEELVLFVLYHRYREGFDRVIAEGLERKISRRDLAVWDAFADEAEQFYRIGKLELPALAELPHLFACFFQIRRAFFNIFRLIVGASGPAVQLRAQVWQSIFTHDLRRYRRVLFDRMADFTTLVIGPTGTGKELVARAVGLSRYIPFDPKTRTFAEDFAGAFHALNLSAMSPTLIESELFGHRRGAFTGAAADRAGWLETCPPLGTVFLDEIGELDLAIQVKLLRVIQTRQFSRLGESEERAFRGKIIAATNRDLAKAMRDGCFRDDFYYRICSDVIRTPSLAERLADDRRELERLVLHIAGRLVGDEAAAVTEEVVQWIESHLGADYAWPGNVRELEQCVRSLLIRRDYQPPRSFAASDGNEADAWIDSMRQAELSADVVLGRYCDIVYRRAGSYEQAAKRLGLDRRTVKAKIDALRNGG